jgi:CDP-diacylglycerol---glycerol-3-phosphate 3-phosphatidyltransferase
MIHGLPNVLTLARIAVIPLLVALFYIHHPAAPFLACGLFLLAAATDWLDGAIARARSQQSAFGRFLDPIADKLLVAAALLMMVGFGQIAGWAILPALVILCREITVSGLREFLAVLRVALPVTQLAKWKTALQMAAIAILLVGDAGPAALHLRVVGEVGLWLAAVLTLITGYDYLRAGLGHMRVAEDSRMGRAVELNRR